SYFITLEVLTQRRIYDGVFIGCSNLKTRSRGFPGELHREQDKRRLEDLVRLGLLVMEHAEGEEECVDSLLFDREPRLLIEAAKRFVERVGLRSSLERIIGVPTVERGWIIRSKIGVKTLVLVVFCVNGLRFFALQRRSRSSRGRTRCGLSCTLSRC